MYHRREGRRVRRKACFLLSNAAKKVVRKIKAIIRKWKVSTIFQYIFVDNGNRIINFLNLFTHMQASEDCYRGGFRIPACSKLSWFQCSKRTFADTGLNVSIQTMAYVCQSGAGCPRKSQCLSGELSGVL